MQFEHSLNFHPLPLWSLTSLSRGSQGGGVYVHYNGVANFEACSIHDNSAGWVCLHLELSLIELSSIAPLERHALLGWQGGGLYIRGTATLTNTSVYDNHVGLVCSIRLTIFLELSSSAPIEY